MVCSANHLPFLLKAMHMKSDYHQNIENQIRTGLRETIKSTPKPTTGRRTLSDLQKTSSIDSSWISQFKSAKS